MNSESKNHVKSIKIGKDENKFSLDDINHGRDLYAAFDII